MLSSSERDSRTGDTGWLIKKIFIGGFMDQRILQIIPAAGWRAVYAKAAGKSKPDFDVPVSCFALVQEACDHEFSERIVPIIVTNACDDAESDNYLGCVGPGVNKDSVLDVQVEYGKNGDQVYKIIKNGGIKQ